MAYYVKERPIYRPRPSPEWCLLCNSTGWVVSSGSLGGEKPCPRCKGTGKAPR